MMKKIITTAAFAMALSCAATAPAAAQNREHVQMTAELRIVQQQQAELLLEVAKLTQALADGMTALNGRLDQSDKALNDAMRKGFANQELIAKQSADDLRVIGARTQEMAARLGLLREEIEALVRSLPSMLTRLQPAAPVGDPLDPNAPPVPLTPDPIIDPPPSTVGLFPERMYGTAYADYTSGQYAAAIDGFEQFLRTFPMSENADNAQQYIGDAHYSEDRFEEAIAAYDRVIQNYPKGEQLPWAYYKRGLVLRRLGRIEEARMSMELAIKASGDPESNVAGLAKQQLDGLTRAPATAAPQRQ